MYKVYQHFACEVMKFLDFDFQKTIGLFYPSCSQDWHTKYEISITAYLNFKCLQANTHHHIDSTKHTRMGIYQRWHTCPRQGIKTCTDFKIYQYFPQMLLCWKLLKKFPNILLMVYCTTRFSQSFKFYCKTFQMKSDTALQW